MNDAEINQLISSHHHLHSYVETITKKMKIPEFYKDLPKTLKEEKFPNIIYTTKGSVFIHVYRTPEMDDSIYQAIEPQLDEHAKKKYNMLLKLLLKKAPEKQSVVTDDQLKEILKELMDEIIVINNNAEKFVERKSKKITKIPATEYQKSCIEYTLIKDLIGGGPLEPFMRDSYLEDIHIIAGEHVHVIHKVFDMIKTSIFIDKEEAPLFTRRLSEKMGAAVSEALPIVDGVLPDGSRGNIIFPESVSIK